MARTRPIHPRATGNSRMDSQPTDKDNHHPLDRVHMVNPRLPREDTVKRMADMPLRPQDKASMDTLRPIRHSREDTGKHHLPRQDTKAMLYKLLYSILSALNRVPASECSFFVSEDWITNQ